MARTIDEIYNEMIAEKDTMASLNGLQPATDNAVNLLNDVTSNSKVAIWRLTFYICAVSIWIFEKVLDKHKSDINKKASEMYTGTLAWYRQKCFEFQYGDSLEWDGNKYVYLIPDSVKQIIKRASVIDLGGQIIIKVAKLSGTSPVPLTSGEIAAFEAYINKVKFGGGNILVISRTADLLKIYYTINYDPLVLTSLGELISSPGTYPVEDAINNYISNLPFNGILNLTKLTDEIQNATGVVDPIINSASAKYGSLIYSPILQQYNANAGHMAIDPLYPLSSTLTYTSI